MKAFREFIFFVYWNGYVKVYHKIDCYWDEDLEQINLSKNLHKHVAIAALNSSTLAVIEWPRSFV